MWAVESVGSLGGHDGVLDCPVAVDPVAVHAFQRYLRGRRGIDGVL